MLSKLSVLFIGNLSGRSTSLFYYQNLLRLGHLVYPFDPDYFDNLTFMERLAIRIRKTLPERRTRSKNELIREIIRQNHFDLVFVMNQNFFSGAEIDEMRKVSAGSPIFIYHTHDNLFAKGILTPSYFFEALTHFDYVFTTKSHNVEKIKALGVSNCRFIPSAYEANLHTPVAREMGGVALQYPVSFIGTFDRSRLPYLEGIGFAHLNVFGENWSRYHKYRKFKAKIASKGYYYLDYARILSQSAISLGLLREEAHDLHTQRTFEIPACGALQMAPRNDEILSFFKENEEIICFSTPAELKDKVFYFLNHRTELEAVVKRAHERLLKDRHTYFHRIATILDHAGLSDKKLNFLVATHKQAA